MTNDEYYTEDVVQVLEDTWNWFIGRCCSEYENFSNTLQKDIDFLCKSVPPGDDWDKRFVDMLYRIMLRCHHRLKDYRACTIYYDRIEGIAADGGLG